MAACCARLSITKVLGEGEPFLREAQGDDYTYGLSEQLAEDSYDEFVSHTWRSNSVAKKLALLYQYNGGFALKAWHATALITLGLQLFWRFVLGQSLPVLWVFKLPGLARWHPRYCNHTLP